MTAITDHLPTLLAWLAQSSLQACLLAGLILLVQWLLRDRLAPRWRYGLWLILLARLVIPWAPSTSFSLYNLALFLPQAHIPESRPSLLAPAVPAFQSIPASADAGAPRDAASSSSPAAEPLPPSAAPVAVPITESSPLTLPHILALLWLAGVLVVVSVILLQSLRLAGLSRHRLVTDPHILNLLEDCKQQMGVPNYLAVLETEHVVGPALFGFIRPRLLLPRGIGTSLPAEQLRHVFLHELAHLKRHDVLISWIAAAVQALHWFNPIVWYAFSRMRAERELACDALALSQPASPEPKAYGRTIVQLLESHIRPRYQPSLAGVLEDKSQLARRITMIASFRKSSQIWSAPAACLLLLVGAVALTNAQTNQPATQSSSIADLTQTARQVVTDMAKGDFDGATDHFDSTMKAAISSKQLQAAWDGVVQQAGPFQQIASTRSEQFAAHRIIYVTCKFQDGLADAKVVFDKTGQIGGLWLQPTPIDSKTSPPAQPSAISFTGEDLKIEPYKEGGLFQAVASVHNTSAQQSGRWEVRLYKGEPKKGNEVSPGGAGGVGPIEPGKTWNEASLPFSLSEGQSTITAVLTPEGATDTTTAIRAAVTVTIRDGNITSCTTAAPNRVAAVQPPPFHPEDMKIVPYTEGNLFYVRVKLHNTSNKTTARCELKYFRGDPRNASPAGGNGATNIDPIAPGDVSDSMSLPFALSEGRNVIACVLRPVDATADTPSQIVALTVTIKDGKIVSQEPAPISSHGETLPQPATQNDPTANDHLLNEGQRLYAEWTDTYFDTIIAAKQYADLSQQAKAELEPKWLAMLNGPKNHGYIQAICNLGAIRSKKAVPPLLGIAIERREKDNADRHFAVEALSMIGDASVVPLLIPLTYHYNQNTRFWAQIALVRLTGQNFGDNWQAWAKWWNSLGKQPQAATVAVKWPCSNPEWLEPEKQKEADAQWIENHGGSAKSARSQEPGPADKAAAAPQEARTLTSQGQSLFDKKNYNEAMATFQQVVDKYPQWSGAENAQMMVGLCHSQLGQHDKAIAAFQHAIHDYPNQDLAATYFYLGSACERVARMDDAVAAYEQSVQRASAIGRGQAFPGKDAQQRIDALKSPKTVSTGE